MVKKTAVTHEAIATPKMGLVLDGQSFKEEMKGDYALLDTSKKTGQSPSGQAGIKLCLFIVLFCINPGRAASAAPDNVITKFSDMRFVENVFIENITIYIKAGSPQNHKLVNFFWRIQSLCRSNHEILLLRAYRTDAWFRGIRQGEIEILRERKRKHSDIRFVENSMRWSLTNILNPWLQFESNIFFTVLMNEISGQYRDISSQFPFITVRAFPKQQNRKNSYQTCEYGSWIEKKEFPAIFMKYGAIGTFVFGTIFQSFGHIIRLNGKRFYGWSLILIGVVFWCIGGWLLSTITI